MASGMEALAAIKARIVGNGSTNEVLINRLDAMDLRKLTHVCLVEVGWDPALAKRVDIALQRDDFRLLGEVLGANIVIDSKAPSLFPAQAE